MTTIISVKHIRALSFYDWKLSEQENIKKWIDLKIAKPFPSRDNIFNMHILVGAFPLVSIDKMERKMVENYLINTLSDLINVNQLSADINSDRARFITPMSILNFIKENQIS